MLAAGLLLASGTPANAQRTLPQTNVPPAAVPVATPGPPGAAAVAAPMPAATDIYRMIWSTIATVDGAIVSGNYSVLRDTAAPSFQAANDTARLAGIFARLRASGIDLSQTMLLTPSFRAAPRLVQPGLLQVQGSFGMRPTAIDFEMLYQWTGGKWRMFGVAISRVPLPTIPPGEPPPAPGKR